MKEVGARLKALRESIKISQVKIGELIGLKQSSINRYEQGQVEAPYKVLLWYANYFDVSMDYIFGRCEKPQGKLYNYEPETFRKKLEDKEEWENFVKTCFDPNSPLNAKLQEAIINLSKGGAENE